MHVVVTIEFKKRVSTQRARNFDRPRFEHPLSCYNMFKVVIREKKLNYNQKPDDTADL